MSTAHLRDAHLRLMTELAPRTRTHVAVTRETIKGKSSKAARPVVVNGVRYVSISDADRRSPLKAHAIRLRLSNGGDANCYYAEEEK